MDIASLIKIALSLRTWPLCMRVWVQVGDNWGKGEVIALAMDTAILW